MGGSAIGIIMRPRDNTSVERFVVQGKVEGTRRGKSPMRWSDLVKNALNGTLHECTRRATVREEWRRIVKLATGLDMTTTITLTKSVATKKKNARAIEIATSIWEASLL